ncbi:dipeptide/oligopeptide/nickel ABC transporter ATP-binding protein [uncultured Tateyamaria sp.]|uniref:ABC transporter ATP-binding protein n=1 Tax=uncultured Tateyamaria sp. TaxID=455651 RepID=UPI00261EA802|nr:dipeptide/oligopeptide/nickel ABC transporter ATP-binding protein [uncultured Tateyamaria sp.]
MLKVDHVSVKRGASVALKGISLSLDPGKTLAVVGESGAGKSTLIAAILGLLKPSHGSITWAGAPVRSCRPALVMQEPRSAFNPALSLRHSVFETVTAGKLKVQDDRLERLCRGLELYPGLLDRRPSAVSIGQAQRVGILRALIAAPPFVLFDEPLSALDAVTQKHTAKLIADLQDEEGFAALIVTHDLGYAVAHADEIAVLKSGRIDEISTPQVFMASPKSEYCRTLRDAAVALGALEPPV